MPELADDKARPRVVPIRPGTLIVLCGIAGSGKSTFAARHFLRTQVVSTDECRALLSDDPSNQRISGWAFDLAYRIIEQRLTLRRTTVMDSTALDKRVRRDLMRIARNQHAPTLLICFDVPPEECMRRDAIRERSVRADVINKQYLNFQRALSDVEREAWDRVLVLSQEELDKVSFVRQLGTFDLRHLTGGFDVIGDVHGCTDELMELVDRLGYTIDSEGMTSHPEKRRIIFLGDLGDRGPHNAEAFALAMSWAAQGKALYTPGNHCAKLLKYLQGRNVRQEQGLAETVGQVEAREHEEPGFKDRLRDFIAGAPTYLWVDAGELLVAHAGIKEEMIGLDNNKVRSMCLYGDTTGEVNPDGTPVRLDWAQHYHGSAAIVYGHTAVPGPAWVNNTMNIDQGCVFGGWLTALRWPERESMQVAARTAYYQGRTPGFLAARVRALSGENCG